MSKLLWTRSFENADISGDSQVFHIAKRPTASKLKCFCVVGVLNFYMIMCRRTSDFCRIHPFLSYAPKRYLNPHYLRAVIVNPAVLVAKYVGANSHYKNFTGTEEKPASFFVRMRFWVSSTLVSDMVDLIIDANRAGWDDKDKMYPNNPELKKFREYLNSLEDDYRCNIETPNLDKQRFVPETALDTVLFQYPLAFCTLTIGGKDVQKFEDYKIGDYRFPLKYMWLDCNNDFKPVRSIPEHWLPSKLHESLSRGDLRWTYIQWKDVKLSHKEMSELKTKPRMVAEKKSPITPGKTSWPTKSSKLSIWILLIFYLLNVATAQMRQ